MAENGRISGLEELETHLDSLMQAPGEPLNAKLFDDVELQLTVIPRLLPKLTTILPAYQHDPKHLVSLSIKLLGPVPFTDVLKLASQDSLVRALQSPAPSANILALEILHKAAKSPSETAILSNMQPVVVQLIHTWLGSPSVDVGEKAAKALGDLLETDCDVRASINLDIHMSGLEITPRTIPGQGLFWRRLFNDRELYSLLFALLSHKTTGVGEGRLDERQKTLAQGRLLRLLPQMAALDFATVSHSAFPDVEAQYGLHDDKVGLLYFASLEMVNREDVLMHLTLMDFFAVFLETLSMTNISRPTMDYLAWLMKQATTKDPVLYKSLESLALSPNSNPELVELLSKLNTYEN